MKKTFVLLLIIICLIFTGANVYAAVTPSPSPTPTVNQQLLDEIASKTAQLNLVEKKGIVGKVSDVSDTQITLTDISGNTRFIDVDELTKFYSSSSKSFGISDITKGDNLGILGLYNKQTRRILARKVDLIDQSPQVIYGAVGSIDKTNYELTVVKETGQKIIAEVQSITKTYSYSSENLVKSGFSKIVAPETLIIIGLPDKQDPSKILATRIVLFPDVQINPDISLSIQNSPSIVPSTGSGTKLMPIVH